MRPQRLLASFLIAGLAVAPAAAQCAHTAPLQGGTHALSGNLEGVKIYPNPWRSDKHGGQVIRFGASVGLQWVMLFTASGKWVRTLYCHCNENEKDWDLTNDVGQPVKSGVYVYLIRDMTGRQNRGTLAVLR